MSRRYDHLADVEAFVAIVEQGSMSAAARAFGTAPSVVSRAIARLEARLGCQLLHRTTRRLSLTAPGRDYLESTQAALAQIDAVERRLQGSEGTPTGRVRLTAPTTYGHHRLPALLAGFAQRHPGIALDLHIGNRNVDLAAEGFDLAIRLGPPPDRALVARRLEDAALVLVASPDYLDRAGMPQDIEALRQHTCLPFVMPSTGRPGLWLFHQPDGRELSWQPEAARFTVSDDVLATVSLAEQGAGICQSYDFVVRERIRAGRLVELLPQLAGRTRPFSLLYARHRQQPAAVRLLIEALVEGARNS